MLSITIDEKSISNSLAGQIDLDAITDKLVLPASNGVVKCVTLGDHGYMLSREFQPGDALLTISLAPDGPLTKLPSSSRQEALGRIFRCTIRLITDRSRSIPVSWRPFRFKNRLSFQADRRFRSSDGGHTEAGRIVLELAQEPSVSVFAFLLDQEVRKDLSGLHPNLHLQQDAIKGVVIALAQPEKETQAEALSSAVALDGSLPTKISEHISPEDWFAIRFTKSQRQFVDYPLTGSVRLVGPAGSGKTVTLVVKCLKELGHPSEDKTDKRFLFLTHASSTAAEIEDMVLRMDPDAGIDLLASDKPPLVIATLYSLANEQMHYDLYDLTPVSLDGYDGRAFQADVLNEIIEDYKKGDWIAFKSGCSAPFVAYMEADKDSIERRFFLWEVLNEFACVLDAEGVRSGTTRRTQYLGEKRKNWMMVLDSREEREVILALYDRFRIWLRNEKAIGGDQMITDFLNHLDSFRWEATRAKDGFDAVFVDELHLFNRQERMIFRHLLRDPNKSPIVFMAYDAKQSPRDTFMGIPKEDTVKYDYWHDARLGKIDKIELMEVFRYTPQITKALHSIDQSFPGQDLDDEWPAYNGISQIEDGPVPIVCNLESTQATHVTVFRRARDLQKRLGRGRRVAVLCASYELYKRYLEYTSFRNNFYAINSRDDVSGISPSSTKFVFSMPEFVAGMQFDTVLLIEVNRSEVPDGTFSASYLRKFASQVYLGASRAEKRLEIYSSQEHGGISPIITQAVLNGIVQKVDLKELEKI